VVDDRQLWSAVAVLGALILLLAVLADHRVCHRVRLDAVGIVPWPLIAIFALFLLAIAAAKLFGLA
jgi:hypothetical protein